MSTSSFHVFRSRATAAILKVEVRAARKHELNLALHTVENNH